MMIWKFGYEINTTITVNSWLRSATSPTNQV